MENHELTALLKETRHRHGLTWTMQELRRIAELLKDDEDFQRLGLSPSTMTKPDLADAVIGHVVKHPRKSAQAFREVQLDWLLCRKKDTRIYSVDADVTKYLDAMFANLPNYRTDASPLINSEPSAFAARPTLSSESSIAIVDRQPREVELFKNDNVPESDLRAIAPSGYTSTLGASRTVKITATSSMTLDIVRRYSWDKQRQLLRVEMDRGHFYDIPKHIAFEYALKRDLLTHAEITDESVAERAARQLCSSHALSESSLTDLLDHELLLVTHLDIEASGTRAGVERLNAAKEDVNLELLLKHVWAEHKDNGHQPDPYIMKGSDPRFDVRQNHRGLTAASREYRASGFNRGMLRARGKFFYWSNIGDVHSLDTLTLLVDFVSSTVSVEGHSNPRWLYDKYIETLMGLV